MSNEIDKEAQAYSDAFHALNKLEADKENSVFAMLSYGSKHSVTAIRRVLLALSSRFGCDLTYTAPPPEPPIHSCDCEHCNE